MRSADRNVKKLSCQYVGSTDTATDHGSSCTVSTCIRALCTAKPEFHDSVSSGCEADAGRLGCDQTLVVDDVQDGSFYKLCLHDRCNDFDHRFTRKHDAAFRNRKNITGKFKILQIVQKILLENAEACKIINVLLFKFQLLDILDDLLKTSHDGIAAVHRVVSEKCIKDNGFVTILVFEVALHHRQFV